MAGLRRGHQTGSGSGRITSLILDNDWPWKILNDPGPNLAAVSVGRLWNALETIRFLGFGEDAYTIIPLRYARFEAALPSRLEAPKG